MTANSPAAKTRSFTWHNAEPDWARMKQLSGLDYLRLTFKEEPDRRPPIGQLMDFYPVSFDEGVAIFEGVPQEFHYNPIGTVHGGYSATLLDSALGCAVHTTLPAGMGYTTLELKVNYVRPLTKDTGLVRAEGRVISAGKRVATAEAKIVDAAGRICSHATTTCLIFPLP